MSEKTPIEICRDIIEVARQKLRNIEYSISTMRDELDKINAFLTKLEHATVIVQSEDDE